MTAWGYSHPLASGNDTGHAKLKQYRQELSLEPALTLELKRSQGLKAILKTIEVALDVWHKLEHDGTCQQVSAVVWEGEGINYTGRGEV